MATIFYLAFQTSCSTPATIETSGDSEIFAMSPTYQITESLGKQPVKITQRDAIARYMIQEKKAESPEYLVVLFPVDVDGKISILLDRDRKDESAQAFDNQIDKLLRAHRLILKGQIDLADELLRRIEMDHDVSYASLLLSSVVALTKGDGDRARNLLRAAKEIAPPDAKEQIFDVIKDTAN